jgi:hypothetical protein
MLWLTDDLDARRYGNAGVLRQLAREVALLEDVDASASGGCHCGAPTEQLSTGRPRKFCFRGNPRRKRPEKRTLQGANNPGERNVT